MHLLHVKDGHEFSMVNTVSDNMCNYSKRQIDDANRARRLMTMMTYPTTSDMLEMIDQNMIHNLPVTSIDIKIAEDLYGTSILQMKGKTVGLMAHAFV